MICDIRVYNICDICDASFISDGDYGTQLRRQKAQLQRLAAVSAEQQQLQQQSFQLRSIQQQCSFNFNSSVLSLFTSSNRQQRSTAAFACHISSSHHVCVGLGVGSVMPRHHLQLQQRASAATASFRAVRQICSQSILFSTSSATCDTRFLAALYVGGTQFTLAGMSSATSCDMHPASILCCIRSAISATAQPRRLRLRRQRLHCQQRRLRSFGRCYFGDSSSGQLRSATCVSALQLFSS